MSSIVENLLWSEGRQGDALVALVEASGLVGASSRPLPVFARPTCELWLSEAADYLGVEVEAIELTYGEVDDFLVRGSPSLVRVEHGGAVFFAAVLGRTWRGELLLVTERGKQCVSRDTISSLLRAQLDAGQRGIVEQVLSAIPTFRNRSRIGRALLHEASRERVVCSSWIVRERPGSSFLGQARRAGLLHWLGVMVLAHAVAYALWLVSWWMLAEGTLHGGTDRALLLGWTLVLGTLLPFQLLTTYAQTKLDVGGGALLKKRLLAGALAMDAGSSSRRGAAAMFGRVMESGDVEAMVLGGGFYVLTAWPELVMAGWVIGQGPEAVVLWLLLATVLVVMLAVSIWYVRARRYWTACRLAMNERTMERLRGQRTRVVQEPIALRHEQDDVAGTRYFAASRWMDRASVAMGFVPRFWLCAGLLSLAVPFARGEGDAKFLVVLGGIVIAFQALQKLAIGVERLAAASVAVRGVCTVFHASASARPTHSALSQAHRPDDDRSLLEIMNVSHRYREVGRPVLWQCNLTVSSGTKLLVEGESGHGKSTLGDIMIGLVKPESGLVLFDGLDVATLGHQGWRRRVAGVPQFHQNHIFSSSLGFNVLLGKRWPATATDRRAAVDLLRELGLGSLLARMPQGLEQMLGDAGWQLSHGERSRIFMARALLQDPEVLVLDESFAALDPETLAVAMRVVRRRAKTLVVIAHP